VAVIFGAVDYRAEPVAGSSARDAFFLRLQHRYEGRIVTISME
jgi:hypothetical protein